VQGTLSGAALGAVVGGAFAVVVFPLVYGLYSGNVTVLNDEGIRTRWYPFRPRRCDWADVKAIYVRAGRKDLNGPSRYVYVEPVAGKPFILAAPMNAVAMPDRRFGEKADEILRYWSNAFRGKQAPVPPKLGPYEVTRKYRHHGLG
jgi:hypothetical protein